jgi:hypothetical protein
MSDPSFHLTDEQWQVLGLPVRLVYAVRSGTRDGSASDDWTLFFPSPAGPTQAEAPGLWGTLIGTSTLGRAVVAEVEALLVHRGRTGGPAEVLLVPITTCFELVAAVRGHWRGFEGGDAARTIVDGLLERMRQTALSVAETGGP